MATPISTHQKGSIVVGNLASWGHQPVALPAAWGATMILWKQQVLGRRPYDPYNLGWHGGSQSMLAPCGAYQGRCVYKSGGFYVSGIAFWGKMVVFLSNGGSRSSTQRASFWLLRVLVFVPIWLVFRAQLLDNIRLSIFKLRTLILSLYMNKPTSNTHFVFLVEALYLAKHVVLTSIEMFIGFWVLVCCNDSHWCTEFRLVMMAFVASSLG